MATPYSEIFNQFLIAVQDYDLLDQGQEFAEKQLIRLMTRAIADCKNMILNSDTKLDLTKRDDELKEFEEDLGDEEIELLVTGMEYFWWHPKLQNSENMYNALNTRDFSLYAPQNLIFRQRENTESAEDRWLQRKRAYIARHLNIATMGGFLR